MKVTRRKFFVNGSLVLAGTMLLPDFIDYDVERVIANLHSLVLGEACDHF